MSCPNSPTPARKPVDPTAYENIISHLDSRSPTRQPIDPGASGDLMSRFRRHSPVLEPAEMALAQAPNTEPKKPRVIEIEYVLSREVLVLVVRNLHVNGMSPGAGWLYQQIKCVFTPIIVSTTSTTFNRILKYWRSICVRDESIPERAGRLVRGVFKTFEDGSRWGYHTDKISDEDVYRASPGFETDEDEDEDEDEFEGEFKDEFKDEYDVVADSMTFDGDRENATFPQEGEDLDQFQDPYNVPDPDQVSHQDVKEEEEENYDDSEMGYSPTRPFTMSPSHHSPTPRGPSPSPSHYPDTPLPTRETEKSGDFFDDNDSAVSLSFSATITIGGTIQTIHFDPDDRANVMQHIDEYVRFCRAGNNAHAVDYNAFVAVRDFTLARAQATRR